MKTRMTVLLTLGTMACLAVAIGVAQTRSAADLFQEALHAQEVKGDLTRAIEIYRTILDRYAADQAIAPKALLEMAGDYEKLGKPEAADAYRRIVRDYAGSGAIVAAAQTKLAANSQKDPGTVVRQVTNLGYFPVSPDGRFAPFIDENDDLAVRDMSSGRKRVLTTNWKTPAGEADYPKVSPDSRSIAYGWSNGSAGQVGELRVISANGGQPRVVYGKGENADWVDPVSWFPDGKSILSLVRRKDRSSDLVVVPLSAGTARTVKRIERTDQADAGRFRVSPDGRWVAYDVLGTSSVDAVGGRRAAGNRDLVLLSLDSGREALILQHPADDYVLDWLPQGSRLLFNSDRGGTYGIWSANIADGRTVGEPLLIRSNTGLLKPLGLTARGDFFYSTTERISTMYVAAFDSATGRKSGDPSRLEGRYTEGSTEPAWSPDGTRIAYVQSLTPTTAQRDPTTRGAGVDQRLAIQTVSTGDVRLFRLPVEDIQNPDWLPNGRELLVMGQSVVAGPQLRQALLRVDIETGGVTTVAERTTPNARYVFGRPQVASDGRRVFFQRSLGTAQTVGVQDDLVITARNLISGAEETVVTEFNTGFRVSPDDRWVAATVRTGTSGRLRFFVVPLSGGEPRPVAAAVSGWDLRRVVAWSTDSRYVFVIKRSSTSGNEPAPLEIWQIPLDGTEPRNTGISCACSEINAIAVHPDGHQLAFGAMALSTKTWVLQNLPPQREK